MLVLELASILKDALMLVLLSALFDFFQAGDTKFNRAKLLNVGFLEAQKDYDWDCFFFHDVDLIPENDHNLYMCENNPKHLVVGRNVTGYK